MAMKLGFSSLFIWIFLGVSFVILQLYSIYMILSVTNPALDLPSNEDANLTPAPSSAPEADSSPITRQMDTIVYGPFHIPAKNATSSGMEEFEVEGADMPCRECLVTFMQAELIHEDGSIANVNTGLWLHHMLMINPARHMVNCPEEEIPERFFGSGNERTVMDIEAHSTELTGYVLPPAQVPIYINMELMSTLPEETDVYMQITYGYHLLPLPNNTPYYATTTVWLDVDACGESDYDPPAGESVFTVPGYEWTSTISGRVVDIGLHAHDGATQLQVLNNDNLVCDSYVKYGENEMFIEPGVPEGSVDSGGDGANSNSMESKYGRDWEHISSISECHDRGRMEAGQKWAVRAQYNFSAHAPMVDSDGGLEPVMAVAFMMIVEDE